MTNDRKGVQGVTGVQEQGLFRNSAFPLPEILLAACRAAGLAEAVRFFVLFAPLCGYYVILADLNMPPSVICHLSSVIRFALGYRLSAIGYFAKRAIGYSRSA
jgi:hypothetical protein